MNRCRPFISLVISPFASSSLTAWLTLAAVRPSASAAEVMVTGGSRRRSSSEINSCCAVGPSVCTDLGRERFGRCVVSALPMAGQNSWCPGTTNDCPNSTSRRRR